ncbi:hypothetical protein HMI51_16965 [Corallococcus coralloides]|nr:hypothetical protein [Corallococcus coralloides]
MTGNKEAAAYRAVSWGDAVSDAFNDKVDAVVHTLGDPTVTASPALPTEPGLPQLAGRIAAIGAPPPAEAITPPDGTASAPHATRTATEPEGTAGIDAGGPRASLEEPEATASGGGPRSAEDRDASRPSEEGVASAEPRPLSGRTHAVGPRSQRDAPDGDVGVPGGMLMPPEEDELDPATGLLRASGAEDSVIPGGLLRPPDEDTSPVHAEPARGRRREKRIIERGPTRADPALDAWCSFCCRPRGEVGDLVAGPAGAFICKGCLGESQGLLGDVVAPSPVRKPVVEEPRAGVVEMVGHDEVKTLLERTVQAGARCLLLVGPEGCGKSLFFQSLQRRGQGVLASVDALESTPGTEPLLVEDVDRLEPRAQATLTAFLANRPARAVVMSARGAVSSLGLWVRGEGGSLPVPTTAGMIEAVQGTVPVSLLERVQVLLPVRRPTVPELVEVARRTLALRQPAVTLSEEVLGAFAAEAVRSPRAGHELQALLSRVYAGSWSLEAAQTPAAPSQNPRGGRKGTP